MLCICLCSCSCFSARFFLGILNQYSWFWKSLNMVDWGCEFSFFQGIHVGSDIRIDISISRRPMATKFGKHIHLEELTQMRLIKEVLVISSHQDHMTNKNISTARVPMANKLSRIVTYLDGLLPRKSHDPYITWSCKIMWETTTIISPLRQCLWPPG